MCHYGRSTKGHAELVASTCRTAHDGVATAFIAAEEPDPQLDSDGKTSFLLLQQFKGYKNNDPGEQSQQCLPFSPSLVSGHGNVSQRCTGVHHHVARSLIQRRFPPLHPEAS